MFELDANGVFKFYIENEIVIDRNKCSDFYKFDIIDILFHKHTLDIDPNHQWFLRFDFILFKGDDSWKSLFNFIITKEQNGKYALKRLVLFFIPLINKEVR